MASMLVLFLLPFIPFAAVEARIRGSSLSSTTPSNSWLSPSGLFAFGFYPERNGFAVGIWIVGNPNNTVVWTANRDSPPVSSNSTIELTTDGNLVLRTEQGTEQTIADTVKVAASASMLDSGNFVLYDNESSVIWESFNSPTDTILGGQTLRYNRDLVSSVSSSDHSSGRFLLSMQSDGNLVARPVNSTSLPGAHGYWGTSTAGSNSLNLTSNGLLYLYNYTSIRTLVNSSTVKENNSTIYRATLDADGMFSLYSHSLERYTVKWSFLQNYCQIAGFCGFNSYCSINKGSTEEAECYCYPGFVFVDHSKRSLGCTRNFSEVPCGSEMSYNITALENLSLGDFSYSVNSTKKPEDCAKSCEEDCNCIAALFDKGSCRKQKLPLRYGTRNANNSATAFFKISLGIRDQTPVGSPLRPTVVTENKRVLISILAVSLGSITCLCFVIAITCFFVYKHKVHRYKKLSENAKLGLTEEFTLRSFSYDELEKATDGFKDELGKGSYGTVYRGTLPGVNKKIIAVKRLENVMEEGDREFQSEVTAIGRTNHRNLVRLLGFCVVGSRSKLLVYEYVSNGSLADHVFKAQKHPSWRDRLRIALDIARGILYLHEECEACIIHCNLKPRNILLDDSFTAKISDFGLAKLFMPNYTQRIGGVEFGGMGSYLAPERQQGALISAKSDIYSFGVVLLEVICCRSNIEVNVSNPDEIILTSWVYKCFVAEELYKLVEHDEKEKVDLKTLMRMVKVGLWCIQDDQGLRPSIKKVILMLEGTVDIPVPPNPSP